MKKIITVIASLLLMVLIGEIIFTIWNKYTIREDFKKVKSNFETVNNFLIDYYEKNCEEECNRDRYMDFFVKITYSDTQELKDLELSTYNIKLEINDELEKSLITINNYYQHKVSGFDDPIYLIKVDEQTIEYKADANPPMVIYYRNTKPSKKEIHENKLEHLSDNWYKTKYEHHL